MAVKADDALEAQRRYAHWLRWTSGIGSACLAITFIVYVAHVVPSYVPIARLPKLWSLPAAQYMQQAGIPSGWRGWAGLILHGDMLVLGAVAMLIMSSILCLAAAVPVFWRRGERLLAAVCVMQIAVLALAAAGVLG